ncbi:cupin domain-containing protein [Gorillibacterium sp. CAU 1737]|uniref:cupin domain-containing protein n=1 Tax=Gorillibacterium sp. CAU 1737 TaxID=3140362 RepID=UPI0032616B99
MNRYMDYSSPDVNFSFDLSNNRLIAKDSQNYINILSIKELNTLGNTSLLDIFLSRSNVVEPHIHQNASELVYCVSGSAVVSLINPFTKKLINMPIRPQQVANVPQGWWHYEVALEDDTHLLAIFDAPVPEFVNGSDILRLTPAEILSHTYCLDEAMIKEALAPITGTVIIGPPKDCKNTQVGGAGNGKAHKPAAMPMGGRQAVQPDGVLHPQAGGYSPFGFPPGYGPSGLPTGYIPYGQSPYYPAATSSYRYDHAAAEASFNGGYPAYPTQVSYGWKAEGQ